MRLSVPERHQLSIARRTIFELSDYGILILGGMTKKYARDVIVRLGTRRDIQRLENES